MWIKHLDFHFKLYYLWQIGTLTNELTIMDIFLLSLRKILNIFFTLDWLFVQVRRSLILFKYDFYGWQK